MFIFPYLALNIFIFVSMWSCSWYCCCCFFAFLYSFFVYSSTHSPFLLHILFKLPSRILTKQDVHKMYPLNFNLTHMLCCFLSSSCHPSVRLSVHSQSHPRYPPLFSLYSPSVCQPASNSSCFVFAIVANDDHDDDDDDTVDTVA